MTDGSRSAGTTVSAASFRDPSGFIFHRGSTVFRQVNRSYAPHFAMLVDSGLYGRLVDERLLVPHEFVDEPAPRPDIAHCVIRPKAVPFISYPYEWCFGQLRDAARLTLRVQLQAIEHGMVLKDASAFNVQFVRGSPLLIDTLSFETYEEGRPWMAYRQFCEHFLAPLLLMRDVDPWLGRFPALTVDGVPLELASKLLGWRSRLSPSIQLHVHQHARLMRRYGGKGVPGRVSARGLSREGLVNLIENLTRLVGGLEWDATGTEWADYATEHGYGRQDHEAKKNHVQTFLEHLKPERVWDLGANTGEFSRIARRAGAWVLSADLDPAAVERNYRQLVADGETAIHPLVVDLRSPSPAIGWALSERESLEQRADATAILALALVHHLAIGGNVPLPEIATWFARLADHLVVEFVPKDDPQVARLLVSREDIFQDYSQDGFEAAFEARFEEVRSVPIGESGRILYLYAAR